MDKKIIDINEYRENKKNNDIPKKFNLYDAIDYIEIIDNHIDEINDLLKEDKKYLNFCMSELLNLLTNVFNSFVSIFDNEIKKYDGSLQSEKVIFFALTKLNRICNEKEKDFYKLNEFAKYINNLSSKIMYYYKNSKHDIEKAFIKQYKILYDVYVIFNEILIFVYDEFDYSEVYYRIIFNYSSEMYKIIYDFTNIDQLKKNFDKKILNFTQKQENNV